MERWKLFYDGGCNLCHTSKLKAEKWAENYGQPLDVDLLQSDEAIEKGYSNGLMVLEVDGKPIYGADAWLYIMKVAPWYLQPIAWMHFTPPTRWLAKFGYGIVARVRYKLFGTRACPLPSHSAKQG